MNKNPKTISIAGAGIMGIMNAYTLQQAFPNAAITLHDPEGFPAHNASFMAGGMISPFSELDHMPERYLSAGLASIDLWSEISRILNDCFEFSRKGSLLISHAEDRHILERFKAILPKHDLWQPIDAQAIRTLEPALPANLFRSGIHIDGEAHLHPKKAIEAMLSVLDNKSTTAINIGADKQQTDWVIDCRGMGAKKDSPTLRGVKGETLVVHNPDFTLSRPLRLMHPRYPLYIVPRDNNVFMIGATIIESENDNHISIRSGMELMSALYSLHPSFGDAQILEMNAGIRPSYPDNMPRVTIDDNVISCNGLYRHGFLFAPIMAQCVASIISGEAYEFNPLFVRNRDHDDHFERKTA